MDHSSVWKGLAFGGLASCIAETFTIPIDVTKTRLQLQGQGGAHAQYRGFVHCMRTMVKQEGIRSLFKGLSPAVLRQATYGSMRYGFYSPIKKALGINSTGTESVPIYTKVAAGTLSGAIASAICNPTDLVKVRMQADGMNTPAAKAAQHSTTTAAQHGVDASRNGTGSRKTNHSTRSKSSSGSISSTHARKTATVAEAAAPKRTATAAADAKPRYRGTMHAFIDISRNEGVLALWKGVGPTCARASVLSAVELASYDEVKQRLHPYLSDGIPLQLGAAMTAGFLSALASSPFDVVKSRVMNQPVLSSGKGALYRGMGDCFIKSVKGEGVLCLWNGFWPNYGRIGPRVVIIFSIMEQLRKHFD